ncbi:phenylalanine--tRNA ligase subunit beta [Desulfoplanes sp.]
MLLSLNWLRDFTPYEGDLDELADRLTMLGLEVDEISQPFAHLDNMVVGHVVECEAHPESDHLHVCKVDVDGGELLDIVCGAPNVARGQKVPVAPVGTVMPGGMKIKKAKLRGVPSRGMICSAVELELGNDHNGIMVLDGGLAPGTKLIDALGLETKVLDIDITPNRGDCLSVLGYAREIAAAYNLPLTMPKVEPVESGPACEDMVSIQIDQSRFCPSYLARIIQGVTNGQSPDWMRYRLLAVGLRPISAVVDVTNYVLMELGQPLHAFDRTLIQGGKIRVAPAEEGMSFTTLDDKKRKLLSSDLLIWDGQRPVALAGVMGGANSEMSETSTDVLLESAVFHPGTIRKTARRLALGSDASFRFERGVDLVGSRLALDRAADLIATCCGGQIARGVAGSVPRPYKPASIPFRPTKATGLLALDVEDGYCEKVLASLGCELAKDKDGYRVTPPSYRLDMEREADLIEEVARVYGMDRLPVRLPRITKNLDAMLNEDPVFAFNGRIKAWAMGCGLHEAVNYSFVASKDMDTLGIPSEGRVEILNPLNEELNVLRSEIAPGVFNSLKHNLAQGNTRLRVFEVAHVFVRDPSSDTMTKETNRLGLLLYGSREPRSYPFAEGGVDYSDIKGLVENLAGHLGIGPLTFVLEEGHFYLQPCVRVMAGAKAVGRVGMLKPALADGYNAGDRVWFADLNLETLMDLTAKGVCSFSPIAKFPAVKRDITIIAPKTLPFGRIAEVILGRKEPLVEDVLLLDIYKPEEDAKENHVSLRVTYRSMTKTLKDKEVDKVHTRIGQELLNKLEVRFP